MHDEQKRTWVEISLSAIEANYRSIRSKLPRGCLVLGVVKANSYGHGALSVARLLETAGCDYLGVACVDEAEELRTKGIKLPLLILGSTPVQYAKWLIEQNITQTIASIESARAFSKALEGAKEGEKLKTHIKLETGMGRLGFDVKRGISPDLLLALHLPNLDKEGIFTHFAASEDPEQMGEYTQKQFKTFVDTVSALEEATEQRFEIKHCSNSGAVINYPSMCLDMVRPGLALYGMYPGADRGEAKLMPAMQLKSRIVAVSEYEAGDSISYGCTFTAQEKTRIAVLPIGYADGLNRMLSNNMDILIHGRRVKQVGRICMDMCMVDVTGLAEVAIGDIATIFGTDGEEFIPVEEQAQKAGTISYELVCTVSQRVPRVVV